MKTTFVSADLAAGMLDVLHVDDLKDRFAPHLHEAYAIGVFVRGSYRLRFAGSEHVTAPGDVIALAPGVIHAGAPSSDEGWSTRMFYPDHALLVRLLGEEPGADDWHPSFEQSLVRDRRLADEFTTAHAALMEGRTLAGEERLVCALRGLVSRYGHSATRRRLSPEPHRAGLTAVREYIHANFAAPIRLTTLAALAGVSPYHLIRLFGREFGVSPYAYVKQLRVVRAQEMLRRGVSATEVAFATGFSDQSHLNRAFKNMLGVTPGAFARAMATPPSARQFAC